MMPAQTLAIVILCLFTFLPASHLVAQDSLNVTMVGMIPISTGEAYRVAVSGDCAYVADGEAGLRVVDVSGPSNPVEVRAPGTLLKLGLSIEWGMTLEAKMS